MGPDLMRLVKKKFTKDTKTPDESSGYNKQELENSLKVIKKIMKMKAAYPFTVPVNREALGLPDYFDVIKLMDFGTIRSNLEKGNTYMNSEDVYKDVQDIWNICPKKGERLMKLVKKKFMKHWTAAGLHIERSSCTAMAENKSRARKRPRETSAATRETARKKTRGSSSVAEKSVVDAVKAQDVSVLEKDTKTPDESSQVKNQEPESEPVSSQNEQKKTDESSGYNKQELENSLKVIKKIMKMKAAYPFTVPVNREALGLPDYFDVIKLMDFGTIRSNLEKGNTYMNSEDVYKDVQDIWNICPKKGERLMKLVKKKFMKHWTAAGLHIE